MTTTDSLTALLAQLKDRKIRLSLKGGKLSVSAPKGALTPELRDALKANRDALADLLSSAETQTADSTPIPRANRSGPLPLSYAQQRMWFFDEFEGGSAVYNIPLAMRIEGPFNPAALQQALDDLQARHEPLRTTFQRTHEDPLQVIHEQLPVAVEHLRMPHAGQGEVRAQVEAWVQTAFDLSSGPLLRVGLIECAPDNWVLTLVIHHIVIDGWSLDVLQSELFAFYAAHIRGENLQPEPLTIQQADYAAWQRSTSGASQLQQQLDYWSQQLSGAPQALELPTDFPRPKQQSFAGGQQRLTLDTALAARIRALANEHNVTLFMVLLSAFQVLLARYSGQEDIVVGTPVAGRQRTELEGLIGLFLNTLAIRGDLTDNPSFTNFLHQIRDHSLDAFANQDLPFDRVVEAVGADRDMSRSPVFQVQFVLQNAPAKSGDTLAGLTFHPLEFSYGTAKFDLTLAVMDTGDSIAAEVEYCSDLFTRESIEALLGHFEKLLAAIVSNPETPVRNLSMIAADERRRILDDWNNTARDYPADPTLPALFEEQVARTPDAPALVFADEQLSYREFNNRVNQLAHWLRGNGVVPDVPVGVCMDRSVHMVTALHAIVKAGGAYVPLDPEYPQQRLQHMLEDARPALILTHAPTSGKLPDTDAQVFCTDAGAEELQQQPTDNPPLSASVDDMAYIIFTSGSTGRPKGVINEHRGICNRLLWMQDEYGLGADDAVLQKTPFSFDVSVWEFFWPLLTGARLIVAKPGGHRDSSYLCELIAAENITTLHFVPSMLQVFLQDPLATTCNSLRRVICSGEALPADLRNRFHATIDAELHNLYGPTEAAIDVTHWPCAREQERTAVPIGYPVANTKIYIVEPGGDLAPPGVAGELWIGGVQVARGYMNRPELTRERFISDPFSAEPGARVYRTGDLARFDRNGVVEFLGRIDHQVKLRGFRIELGEIEAALDADTSVGQSVVIVHERSAANQQLVAYLIATATTAPDTEALSARLAAQLPEYMVPSAYVVLDEFPLLSNGKVNRKALPEPEYEVVTEEYVAPRDDVERTLCAIWAEVLDLQQVGINDDFFALGGHSLLATRVIIRVREQLDTAAGLRTLFENPSVAGFAAQLGTGAQDAPPPISAVPHEEGAPLSFAQQRLWFLDQMEPGSDAYNIPAAARVRGALNASALQSALDDVVTRHESLRTTFVTQDEQPLQIVAAERRINIEPGLIDDTSELAISKHVSELMRQPFDLANGPLLRVHLLRAGDHDHVLAAVFHHIIADAESVGIFFADLLTAYRRHCGESDTDLAPLTVQQPDYAIWQRNWLRDEELERQTNYWRERLAGAPQALELPTDFTRPAVQTFTGSVRAVTVDTALTERLRSLGREQQATLFMVLQASFSLLLARYSGQSDVLLGSPVSGRSQRELEHQIGMYVNTLVLRNEIPAGISFNELLAGTADRLLEAQAHQDMPFEKLVEELQPIRDMSRSPLFQVMFTLVNADTGAPQPDGLHFEPVSFEQTSVRYDLNMTVQDLQDSLIVRLEFNTDLFRATTIERMLGHFCRLLDAVTSAPGDDVHRLPLLDDAEQHQLLQGFNDTAVSYPDSATLHELFSRRVAQQPDAIAVESTATGSGAQKLSYAELDQRSNGLAQRLRELGAGPDVPVALCTDRTPELLTGILGILKAGAAYVPLDPDYPDDRIAYMLEDSGAEVLVTTGQLVTSLPTDDVTVVYADEIDATDAAPVDTGVTADNLAYVIYTSGSTGKPKGVQLEHRGVVNFLESMAQQPGLSKDDRLLAVTTLCFDISVLELLLPLLEGATVVLATREQATDAYQLSALLAQDISVMQATPATWRLLLQSGWSGQPRLKALCGGEALERDLAEDLHPRVASLWNMYGPTETTIWSSLQLFDPVADLITVGRPIANTQMYILDELQQPVPTGVNGELYIGGDGVARGYRDRPELTAEKFMADPFRGGEARMYRTGDLARFLPDGQILVLGRTDFQVKLRGFRIELGEIESALAAHSGINQAVVILREDNPGDQRLVAYYTGAEPLDGGELRERLARDLPDYMVPAAFMHLDPLPLTPNGKVDRKALPAPEYEALEAYVAPRNDVETALCEIWADILGVEQVGINDNFFTLGGHSLLATQLVARAREQLQQSIELRSLFNQPTVAGLAAALADADAADQPAAPTIEARDHTNGAPLSFAQQRLWFLDQLEPLNDAYNVTTAARLRGHLDLVLLQQALDDVVARHESLRTVFTADGEQPTQKILPDARVILTEESARGATEDTISQRLTSLFSEAFDLAAGPLARLHILTVADDDHVLGASFHHIIADAASFNIFFADLLRAYDAHTRGAGNVLEPLSVQSADYALWQHDWLQGEELERQADYWKDQLAGAPQALDLPTDLPRPAVQTTHGDVLTINLDTGLTRQLRDLAQSRQATLFVVLQAAFSLLLARYSRQDDVLLGVPVSGRSQQVLEDQIGMYVNTLVLRTQLDDNTRFAELVDNARDTLLEAQAHQDMPFEKLVEELQPVRDMSRSPIFQALFTLLNVDTPTEANAGLQIEPVSFGKTSARFELNMTVQDLQDSLLVHLEFNTDLFHAATINRMLGHYLRLLTAAVASPDANVWSLPLLDNAEQKQLIQTWNNTAVAYPDRSTLHDLFSASAKQRPDATAIEAVDGHLSYAELERRSNGLAQQLRKLGAGPDLPVALCTERTTDLLVGILGILKAGAAYVPLDPDYPDDRIAYMLEDSGAGVLVTVGSLVGSLPTDAVTVVCADKIDGTENAPVNTGVTADHLAYIIYTSGSTGKPKGVQLEHRGVINFLQSMAREPGLNAGERLLAVTTLCFDISVLELLLPLLEGGTVVLASREQATDAYQLSELLAQNINVMQATPATWRLLLQSGWQGQAQLKVLCGGEALDRDLAGQLQSRVASVWNMYGPTETTIWSSLQRFEAEAPMITVGRPIANTQMYILDDRQQVVPMGVNGELYIGGDGVARGYRDRPELTAERFVADPFRGGDARMYRTGDLARFLPDGQILILGRTDFQVKLRGFRIELGEIEAALSAPDVIEQAVVVLREDNPGDQRLVAYYTGAGSLDAGELRERLSRDLPDYMVPAAFMYLDALPLTPNGKVDRKALPAPEYEALEAYIAPRNDTEAALCDIWADILGVEQVGINDNFFTLGGHSLLATQLVARAREQLQQRIELRSLFNHPTIAGLAGELTTTAAADQPAVPTIKAREPADSAPLSFAQQRLWFLDQMGAAGASTYIIPGALRIRGHLDHAALQSAVDSLVQRHEALRTVFVDTDEGPLQQIRDELTVPIVRESPAATDTDSLRRRINELTSEPFDLATGPLLRMNLLDVASDDCILVIAMHHIVSDGWSIDVISADLAELYSARLEERESRLPDLSIQYADYSLWQREHLSGDAYEQQLDYWREQLRDAPAVLELPTDRARPPVQTYAGSSYEHLIDRDTLESLRSLARAHQATLFMGLLTAFNALLARYTGQTDIVVGSPIAGRSNTQLESLIGFFVNTLALRSDLSGDPNFIEQLERTRDTALAAYEHQDLPFEKLVEELQPSRNMSYSPFFQVMFVLQQPLGEGMNFAGLELANVDFDVNTTKFDLTFTSQELRDGLLTSFSYNTDLFDRSTIKQLAVHFERLLKAIVAKPHQALSSLSFLADQEREELLVTRNATQREYPATGLQQRFETQASNTPNKIAVSCDGEKLTYAELNARANRMAHYLRDREVGHEALVALSLDRSIEAVVTILAIIKAGGAYVPLDPAYPEARLKFMLKDTDSPLLLTRSDINPQLETGTAERINLDEVDAELGAQPDTNPPSLASASSLAYVIYTSGSTGQPKGTLIEQKSVMRLVINTNFAKLGDGLRIGMLAPISFDASTLEIWGSLLNGGEAVVFSHRTPGLDELRHFFADEPVDLLWLTSTLFNSIVDTEPEILLGTGTIMTGGEALSISHIRKATALLPGTKLINGYGPTESTTFTTTFPIPEDQPDWRSVPIGKPIANTRVYVLDERLQAVPAGVVGELYIGGDGLSRGYLNQPDMTAEKFVSAPISMEPSARLYRTGDRVRFLRDGNIEFMGRVDDQVKLRGFRIELGEIEAALREHPAINDAAAIVYEVTESDKRLVAYAATDNPVAGLDDELLNFVTDKLPSYMVPSAVMLLDQIPQTANGKLDRRALPAPQWGQQSEYTAPRTPAERLLCELWATELKLDKVGIHDDFFAIGGHSLLIIRLIKRIENETGERIEVATVFEHPTVAGLASKISTLTGAEGEQTSESSGSVLLPIRPSGNKPPLFCIHGEPVKMARVIDNDQPLYGIYFSYDPNFRMPDTIEELAATYIQELKKVQPEGPYHLVGYCLGGLAAFEMARQLRASGDEVRYLALIDPTDTQRASISRTQWVMHELSVKGNRLAALKFFFFRAFKSLASRTHYVGRILATYGYRLLGREVPFQLRAVQHIGTARKSFASYSYKPVDVEGVLFCADLDESDLAPLNEYWSAVFNNGLTLMPTSGLTDHFQFMQEPFHSEVAKAVGEQVANLKP